MVYSLRGQFSLAASDFRKAVKLEPRNRAAKQNLEQALDSMVNSFIANAAKKKKKTSKKRPPKPAKTKQVKSQKNNTKFAETLKNKGNVYFAKGDYKKAIALYTKAIKADPNYGPAYNNRGNSYGRLGEYARGIADLTKALAVNPNTADVHYFNRAKIYEDKGDYTRSIADYTTALELKPKDIGTLLNRGEVFILVGKHNRAIKDFKQVVNISPKSAYYRHFLGRGLYDAGNESRQCLSGRKPVSWRLENEPKDGSVYLPRQGIILVK